MSVITLTLLHPLKSIAVQKWNFEPNSVIRIGRANDNEVVLYSAVVSRHHLEIRPRGNDWALVNLGSNGTFINGKKINKVLVKDGMVIRLASSGPKIKITLVGEGESNNTQESNKPKNQPLTSRDISKDTVMN
ncbi:FHA domain-containing protein [Geminocystis sp. GBBB08]|uniref:FHA domain-containing protein n=1 Tax=Geminocystis sp. GBBB08 TaxID=2604140 RepID=UPI0027E28ADD|nr:FHA domain-containing protein [Geminocystis sp. GBBB08]